VKPATSAALAVFVRREGDASWAKVVSPPTADVADLVKTITTELRIPEPASAVTLHPLGGDGKAVGEALAADTTLAEALGDPLPAKIRLVVKVSTPAPAGKAEAGAVHAVTPH